MHFTLHLTNKCNMACSYCYVCKDNGQVMDMDTARKAVDLSIGKSNGSIGIIFFGGEPLLHKDLICGIIEYCKWKESKADCHFHYKVTTNGMLLDEEFMDFSLRENIFVALSHDGIREAHDKNRLDNAGEGTFDRLSSKIDLLLSNRPYSPVMMVVDPSTADYYYESVVYLYDRGFRYIICSLNYASSWDDAAMKKLGREYKKLASFYFDRTIKEEKFYLSPFEVKISSHINRDTYRHERCELGKKQISVAPDGRLYPCVQFVGEDKYSIGDVDRGIDEKLRLELYDINEEEKDSCKDCVVRERCNHYCGCMNKQTTGRIDRVSPVLCQHERILLPIADRLAERLYKKRNGLFIQKHYNDMYPLISAIEDSKARDKTNSE